ncbi:asparagine synthase (glutamine-hydrolyzing) [Schinkia azotoformans]|uniref:asparagine synthase (glutamine-hydrolyzing) n=1 Tax=Schinkia azotoformans TaxID=1454 RepID=UPI002DBACFA9|nr:asparagine synthase (glutamine-hydrolyzing) [Schinkia azotoformans]MEC1742822.1 asparagine synthase (glutamine-hydrolyzing) [Schinkia azotoformans]MEC1769005.1 asparagine synthase (glutamine-hydrolyzing) [Schinkia azotoformans]MEC1789590.1 asparagine synthase (glutamine-hydrolyzing) [Schinkia azotoformans]MED4378414.1 asparagine synthase (glutamine-hydrolyzing) [Schinkia azotoformans]MED4417442.1 asparagine synthase (glutamine-hydrolyzing) [Schinkia azotoformans]
MCGFVGCLYNKAQKSNRNMKNKINEMNTIITHRGPDSEGYYFDEHINFGFRRLSIIDLESGNQPLSYENERYWMIFNGEIYNYIELREELINKGYKFSTESDTEVIIALYSDLKEQTVKKLRGMFAFVIWDKIEHELFGARDYFGIKPFFYSEKSDTLYFASEKKSILLAADGDLNQDSLQYYLSFQYVPEPDTLTSDIKKLQPGHYFVKKPNKRIIIRNYWKPQFQPVNTSDSQLVKEIRDVLTNSVNMHMRSDVPVGSFLSGGIDSSFIVSLAKQINPGLKTFSVGFEREGYSEVNVAQETASALNLENISYIITPDEFINELPKIIWHMDDPLADPAAVPLYFVSREASKHVKVALSGEGADELFGGYNIYREPYSLQMFNYIPRPIKRLLKIISQILPDGVKGKSFIERGVTPLEERYIGNAKMFEEEEKEVLLAHYRQHFDYKNVTKQVYKQSQGYDPVTKMQHLDIHTWLRGDILLKADKMTMAHSLELRVPFLDIEVFKIASKIHSGQKINNNTTKYILRKAAEGIVPDHVLNRKKLGFPVPIRHWLKDELYDWAFDIIDLSPTDYLFNKQHVHKLLEQHVTNKKDNSRKLWTLLVFMIWHEVFIENRYEFGHNGPTDIFEKELVLSR